MLNFTGSQLQSEYRKVHGGDKPDPYASSLLHAAGALINQCNEIEGQFPFARTWPARRGLLAQQSLAAVRLVAVIERLGLGPVSPPAGADAVSLHECFQ